MIQITVGFLLSVIALSQAMGVADEKVRSRRQLGTCSWGAVAVSACHRRNTGFFFSSVSYYCGLPNYQCDLSAGAGGRCCLSNGGTVANRCPDGSVSAGSCSFGFSSCSIFGYYCTSSNLCCRSTTTNQICPDGTYSTATCNNLFGTGCTAGYYCTAQNYCCRSSTVIGGFCPDGTSPFGSCFNGAGCSFGYYCTPQNTCCRGGTGTTTCPDGSLSLGTCSNGFGCGLNQFCNGNICCRTNSGSTVCPFGDNPIGNCVIGSNGAGLCPPNYTCRNNNCCSGIFSARQRSLGKPQNGTNAEATTAAPTTDAPTSSG